MKLILSVVAILGLSLSLWAEEPISSGMSYDESFQSGKWEATLGAAAFFSPFGATRNRATYDYALASISAGYMVTDIREWGPARGNFEFLGELFGGPVFVGHGNYVSGMTLWGRYNFIQPNWKFVPFAGIGLGLGATDIDQKVIGQVFQFNIDIAIGGRYFFRPDLALVSEYRFQHISNANTGQHNLGINAQGVFLGVAKFF